MATIGRADEPVAIRTPDQRLRVFVSSTLGELGEERSAVRAATEQQRLSPVMFELGARPHPPRRLYRAYLAQSDIFVGIYWQRYGWIAPGEEISGLEDEYRLAGELPRLLYLKEPAPQREPRLAALLDRIKSDDRSSYKRFTDAAELAGLVADDLAVLLAERFEATATQPPARSVPATAPVPLTETVGRRSAIDAIATLLRDGARLVTLTGPGGVGKTRLAQEVARATTATYPGGTQLVALAPVTDAALVMRTVADRLGVAVEGTQDPALALAERLSGAARLVVLDNLEQVATVGPELVSLLEHCPQLRILATSRQALRVRGEHEWPVDPLPVPPPDRRLPRLDEEPAVQLFLHRAREAGAGFGWDEDNAEAVAELSRRLDGLPLAIELAAARTRLLPPPTLLARLDHRLDALGTGGPDRPPRQRTVQATVDWSHDLLTDRERAVFARLGVFAGSFTLAAAEAVCGEDPADDLDTLASLVDKSLVATAETSVDGEPRLQLLETVRSYARRRLDERGQTERTRRRHLDWYCAFGERAQPYLCGPGQREWAARLDPERANLRAAVRTAQDLEDDVALIDLTWDVIVYYFVRDAVQEPESWLQHVSSAGRPLDRVPRAKLDSLLTLMRIHRGEFAGARAALESALAVFRTERMDFESAVTLKELAWVRYAPDADAVAVSELEESSRLFEEIGHGWGVALAEVQLASVLVADGDLVRAEQSIRRSLACSRGIDNGPLIAQALQHQAMIRVLQSRPREVVPLIEEAAQLLREGSHQTEAAACLDVLAAASVARGAYEPADRALRVADAVRRKIGISRWPSDRRFVADVVAATRAHTAASGSDTPAADIGDADVFDVLAASVAALRSATADA